MIRDRIGRRIPKRPCKRKECLAQKARIAELEKANKEYHELMSVQARRVAELEEGMRQIDILVRDVENLPATLWPILDKFVWSKFVEEQKP